VYCSCAFGLSNLIVVLVVVGVVVVLVVVVVVVVVLVVVFHMSRKLIRNCYIFVLVARFNIKIVYLSLMGTADGGTVVKVLCYKSEGRWFNSRWCRNFSLT
jgi:hypothetical protein